MILIPDKKQTIPILTRLRRVRIGINKNVHILMRNWYDIPKRVCLCVVLMKFRVYY